MIVNCFFVICAFVFAYHYERNGNPIPTNDTVARILWVVIFALGYVSLSAGNTDYYLAAGLAVLQFTATLVPHAWVQNMGMWAVAQRKWPGFFLPVNWPSVWVPSSFSATLHDFIGMMSVGFFRGLLVFGIPLALSFRYHSDITWAGWLAAWWFTALAQPFSYLIGTRLINSSLWGNVPRSATWGEFLVGVSWALGLILAVFVP